MKNYRILYSVFFLFIFFLISNSAFAQKGIFVDADLSIFPNSNLAMGQIACTSGYRFNKMIAAGLEYRGAGYATDGGRTLTMNGLGLVFRLTNKRFFGKITHGLLLTAKHVDDSPYFDKYDGGGSYNSLTMGYRFRSGFLLGGTYTLARNTRHIRTYYDDGNFDNMPPEEVTYGMKYIGITLGVAFPRESQE